MLQLLQKSSSIKRISQTKKSFYSRLDKNLSFNNIATTALNPHSAIAFFVKQKSTLSPPLIFVDLSGYKFTLQQYGKNNIYYRRYIRDWPGDGPTISAREAQLDPHRPTRRTIREVEERTDATIRL